MTTNANAALPAIALVHGGFVDGSLAALIKDPPPGAPVPPILPPQEGFLHCRRPRAWLFHGSFVDMARERALPA
jgi:hypothetical protein